MKILLSVFACAPNTGSETGVGWRWAVELARAGHHVVAVTDETRRNQIENELELRPVPGLRFEFYRPVWLKRIPLNSKTAQLLFSAWQYSLLPFARGLHRLHRFDAVIHLTYGVFRTPSFLGGLKIPFVFGPVGGGEDAPWALKQGLPWRELIKEVVRTALIKISPLNPALRACLNSASVILVKTKDTKDALPRKSSARAIVYHEIGIQRQTESLEWTPIARGVNEPLRLLFAGRLLGWKGVHLALKAVALARQQGCDVRLTVVGSGPLSEWLHDLAEELQIGGVVEWRAQLKQQELFAIYREMHGLLFPSLHDSSGNVVLEALDFGLPVICLALGGPASLVSPACAIAVEANAVQTEVIAGLAAAIQYFGNQEQLRQKMSAAAREHASQMTWANRAAGVVKLVEATICSNSEVRE